MGIDVINLGERDPGLLQGPPDRPDRADAARRRQRDVVGVGGAPYPTSSASGTAPRVRACSRSSRITAPAPSPITKPSRPRSNGREAAAGLSLRVERARIAAKPPTSASVMPASDEPAIITSASPRRMISHASPRAWPPVAQAEETAKFGPSAPNRIAAWPDARFGIAIGMKNGLIRSGPFWTPIVTCSAKVLPPPIPVPRRIPVALGELAVEALGEARLGHRLVGRDQGELRIAVVAALLLAVEHHRRIEVRHLAPDLRGDPGRVEGRDPPDPRAPGEQPVPGRRRIPPEGGHEAQPGDDDSPVAAAPAGHRTSFPVRIVAAR